jgi:hypothetical protein
MTELEDLNIPTQAKSRLEWATRRSVKSKACDAISLPPTLRAKAREEWGTLSVVVQAESCATRPISYLSDAISITKRYFTSLFAKRS